MPNDWGPIARPGLGNVGSYQISGFPYLTGSNITGNMPNNGEVNISLPYVTRAFTVVNTAAGVPIIVTMASRGSTPNVISHQHYFTLTNLGDSLTFTVRTTNFYVSNLNNTGTGSFSAAVELTTIGASEMQFPLSGAGIND